MGGITGGGGATVAGGVSTVARPAPLPGSAMLRMRRTVPSRSALLRMFWIRLMVCSFTSRRLDARNLAEHRQLEFVLQIPYVVHGSVEVLAADRQRAAEADARENRHEHHAQRDWLDRVGRP